MAQRARLDVLVVTRGLAPSREAARRLIMAGEVRVDGAVRDKPGMKVADDVQIDVSQPPRFVSRGGDKLDAALEAFALDVAGWVCADVGASTGGFTDCLLQRGAARVYSIDVGYGQLDYRLRQDQRVIVMERTNARYLAALDERVDGVVIDASFISLRLLLPVVKHWLRPSGTVVVLIKPQFEAGKSQVGKGGVVRDPAVHRDVLERVLTDATTLGYRVRGIITSPLKGPAGNIEFLAWLTTDQVANEKPDDQVRTLPDLIHSAFQQAHGNVADAQNLNSM